MQLGSTMVTVHDFEVQDADGQPFKMSEFKGKVLLIVNVASKCGLTPQYKGLQALQDTFKDQPFTVVGFPCNQFAKQEPGSAKDVCSFATQSFRTTFPIMEKINVNGKGTHPLYVHLKEKKKGMCGTRFIKWNFTKFLVDSKGEVIARFGPNTEPHSIKDDIEKLLKDA